jgi:anti-sigma regulatory factor (Ser/Thr protein kinase)
MDSRREILATTQLPPELASAGRARRFVRDVLHQEGPAVDVEVVALLTSEVVTNAVLHAGTDVDLVVRSEDGCIRVEASDTGEPTAFVPHVPARSESGRGITIIAALSAAWGVIPTARGKTVWFRCPPLRPQ